jgi:hypothetical protein
MAEYCGVDEKTRNIPSRTHAGKITNDENFVIADKPKKHEVTIRLSQVNR